MRITNTLTCYILLMAKIIKYDSIHLFIIITLNAAHGVKWLEMASNLAFCLPPGKLIISRKDRSTQINYFIRE